MTKTELIGAILTITDLVSVQYNDDTLIQDAMTTIRNLTQRLGKITLQFDPEQLLDPHGIKSSLSDLEINQALKISR